VLVFGDGFRYAHVDADGYAAGVRYFPDDMAPPQFYAPTVRGLEAKLKERLEYLHELDRKAGKPRGSRGTSE
jgi:putative ATPase